MVFITLTGLILAVDLYLKSEIEKQDAEKFPRELEGSHGKILLYQNHNTGFPFGFLREYPELVKNIPLMMCSALGGIFAWLSIRKGFLVEKLALSMTLGGALSNLYDRIVRKYVVDYFSIQWRWLKKVVFNLGDIFIFLGAGVILVLEVVQSIREE